MNPSRPPQKCRIALVSERSAYLLRDESVNQVIALSFLGLTSLIHRNEVLFLFFCSIQRRSHSQDITTSRRRKNLFLFQLDANFCDQLFQIITEHLSENQSCIHLLQPSPPTPSSAGAPTERSALKGMTRSIKRCTNELVWFWMRLLGFVDSRSSGER